MLCLSCCLIFPLPETILYDLPDSLNDLQSMIRSVSSENGDDVTPSSQQYHHQPQATDSNTLTKTRETRSPPTIASDLNDLSGSPQSQEVSTPKTILRSKQGQVATGGGGKTVTIHSQPEIIQLQSNSSIVNALSNPCYFAGFNDTADQYDIERHTDNRVVISIRGGQIGHAGTNNNNNESGDLAKEATKF